MAVPAHPGEEEDFLRGTEGQWQFEPSEHEKHVHLRAEDELAWALVQPPPPAPAFMPSCSMPSSSSAPSGSGPLQSTFAREASIAKFAQSQDEAQDEAQWLQNVIQRIDAREGKKSVSAPMTIEPKRMLPKSIVAGVHKTELCPSLRRKGTYAYGSACVFAHGESDLKPRHRDGRCACLTLGAMARQTAFHV